MLCAAPVTPPRYGRAAVRDLSSSFSAAALTSLDNSSHPIDMDLAHHQHKSYTEAVGRFVPLVHAVPSDPSLPDCCFIEDTCVIVNKVAVITRPGHVARQGETAQVKKTLESLSHDEQTAPLTVLDMPEPCLLDGGDVLFTGTDIFVGLSKRTNQAGADFLAKVFHQERGFCPVHVINMLGSASSSTLHLKCVVTALTGSQLVVSDDDPGRYVQGEIEKLTMGRYSYVFVPDQVAANILRFPDGQGGLLGIVVQKLSPNSTQILRQTLQNMEGRQPEIIELDMSEFIKADGALTCCSLLI